MCANWIEIAAAADTSVLADLHNVAAATVHFDISVARCVRQDGFQDGC